MAIGVLKLAGMLSPGSAPTTRAVAVRSSAVRAAPTITRGRPTRKPGRNHPFLAESAVLREALGRELYEAVLALRRAGAELFAMFTDADVIDAVRSRY
ncbi:hypothetical protein [Streptomyces sp. NPDC001076]